MNYKDDVKKILMITHSANKTGGGENDFQTLLEYFNGRYYILSIVPEGPRVKSIMSLSNEIMVVPDKIYPFEELNMKKYLVYIYFSIIKLFTLIPFIVSNRKKIDVAFVNSSVCILEILVLVFLKVPYNLSIKEIMEPKLIRTIFYKLFHKTSKNVIVISNSLKELYREVNKDANPVLIRSAIDEGLYLKEKSKLADSIIEKNSVFTIVNIGVINPSKNQKLLIDAISEIDPNVKFKILFIGKVVDVKYYDYLKQLITTYDLKNAEFVFTKEIPKNIVLKEIYKSDCVVITSQKEGMSLVLVESLFMEKPVIATPVGVIPEIIKNGCNGFIINNSNELSGVIEKIRSDSELINHISSNTYKSYEGSFRMDYYKSKHEEVLFDLNV